MWALSSYFLYLYMFFLQPCFCSEQHCFHSRTDIFQCYFCVSNFDTSIKNWLIRVLNSIWSIHTELLFDRLSCSLSFSFYIPVIFVNKHPSRVYLFCLVKTFCDIKEGLGGWITNLWLLYTWFLYAIMERIARNVCSTSWHNLPSLQILGYACQ